jgi:hypothetical protein
MGKNNFGAPREDIQFLKSQHSTSVFIETGTFRGDTANWAASLFNKVVTIEGLKSHHESATARLSGLKNVDCLYGDSRTVLGQVLKTLRGEPTLFWLDAHWMPGSYGDAGECPIIEELKLIGEMSADSIILVDDARLFLAPPPRPHRASDWPTIDTVLEALNAPSNNTRYNVVYDDVIFSVPGALKDATLGYFQNKITEEMNAPSIRPSIARRLARKLFGS